MRSLPFSALIVLMLMIPATLPVLMPAEQGAAPAGGETDFMVPGETGFEVTDKTAFEGVSWAPVQAQSKTTLVGFDPYSYLDDYAFMASVPASTFYQDGTLYSSPLLFYEDSYVVGGPREEPLNSRRGVDYFMDDWMTFSGYAEQQRGGDGVMDALQLINLAPEQMDEAVHEWPAAQVNDIHSTDPYRLAAEIALDGWESSERAVIVPVMTHYPELSESTGGTFDGIIPDLPIRTMHIEDSKEVGPVPPQYHNFTIDPGYKFIDAYMKWGQDGTGGEEARGKDLDMQLYDWQLGEVAASEEWNVIHGSNEHAVSYIYHDHDLETYEESGETAPAPWAVAVTYMPTEPLPDESHHPSPGALERVSHAAVDGLYQGGSDQEYEIDLTFYPGVDTPLPEETPFMTRDASFEITWDAEVELGFLVMGPEGAELTFAGGSSPLTVDIAELGRGQYSIAVVKMDDSRRGTGFHAQRPAPVLRTRQRAGRHGGCHGEAGSHQGVSRKPG